MDKAEKDDLRARLKRIAGQVGGIQRMLDEDRTCLDVVMQVSAARAALAKVGRLLFHEHIATSLAVIAHQGAAARRHTLDELLRSLERCDL
jgi:CsoR family transcriptional regulator, copper-sensing transcriptional repressor